MIMKASVPHFHLNYEVNIFSSQERVTIKGLCCRGACVQKLVQHCLNNEIR